MTKSNTLSQSLPREAIVDHRLKLTAAQVAEIRRRYARKGVLQRSSRASSAWRKRPSARSSR